MLAPKKLSAEFARWNEREGAPSGKVLRGPVSRIAPRRTRLRRRGPYAWQRNSISRTFEYPWAYYALAAVGPDRKTVVEFGGALSGFQFTLAREGHTVLNVDPGRGYGPWGHSPETIDRHAELSEVFRAPAHLIPVDIVAADLPDSSADAVVSISTIEHLSDEDMKDFVEHIPRVLKPGAHVILTIDLFLNLAPFTSREENEFGRNVDVRRIVEGAGLLLVEGDPAFLLGYPDFDTDRILSSLERFLIGSYPVLTQCMVARSDESASPS